MFEDLSLVVDFVFTYLTKIVNLYTGSILLSGVLALWLLRKVVNVFRKL